MAKAKRNGEYTPIRPGLTPESRESQLISLAVDLAEKQLIEGTASSQVISHFLKLGSTKYQIEKRKLEKETELLEAKASAIKSAENSEKIYQEAIEAMKSYGSMG